MVATSNNPLIHRDRRLGREPTPIGCAVFACEDMTVLIVCRGPIRKEALDVFSRDGHDALGRHPCCPRRTRSSTRARSPPSCVVLDPSRTCAQRAGLHGRDEAKSASSGSQQIIEICRKNNGYEYIFAGYGFMAEDEDFVRAIENAGLRFIGPCSHTVQAAAARTRRSAPPWQCRRERHARVSTTPPRSPCCKVSEAPGLSRQLSKLVSREGLSVPELSETSSLDRRRSWQTPFWSAGYDAGDRPLHDRRAPGRDRRDRVQEDARTNTRATASA